jgi:hypothetical protein
MRLARILWLTVLLTPAAPAANFDSSSWKFRADVIPPQTDPAGFVKITLPGWLLANASESLWDIRLVSQSGIETPYVIKVARSRAEQISLPVRTFNWATDPGRDEQVMCDLGETPQISNQLLLRTDSRDFIRTVEISGSADQYHWVVLQSKAYIFDQQEQGRHQQKLTVSYPDSSYRYLRVLVWLDGQPPIRLTGVEVLRLEKTEVQPEVVNARIVERIEDAARYATDLIVETEAGNQHLDTCVIQAKQQNFSRAITVSYRDARGTWVNVGNGNIHRFTIGDAVDTNLEVPVNELNHRRFRIRIWNGSSPPLDVTSVAMRRMPRVFVFSRSAGDRHTLYFRNSQAGLRSYDIATAVDQLDLQKLPAAALGPMTPNPAYREVVREKPWTERHPALIWIALAVGVLLLAGLLFQTVRGLGKTTDN